MRRSPPPSRGSWQDGEGRGAAWAWALFEAAPTALLVVRDGTRVVLANAAGRALTADAADGPEVVRAGELHGDLCELALSLPLASPPRLSRHRLPRGAGGWWRVVALRTGPAALVLGVRREVVRDAALHELLVGELGVTPGEARLALRLHRGLSHEAVAAAFGITPEAARQRVSRLARKLVPRRHGELRGHIDAAVRRCADRLDAAAPAAPAGPVGAAPADGDGGGPRHRPAAVAPDLVAFFAHHDEALVACTGAATVRGANAAAQELLLAGGRPAARPRLVAPLRQAVQRFARGAARVERVRLEVTAAQLYVTLWRTAERAIIGVAAHAERPRAAASAPTVSRASREHPAEPPPPGPGARDEDGAAPAILGVAIRGREVSHRLSLGLVEVCRRRRLAVGPLLEGLGVTAAALQDTSGWHAWDDCAVLFDRVAARVGGPEAMARFVEEAIATVPSFRAIGGLVSDPRVAYRYVVDHMTRATAASSAWANTYLPAGMVVQTVQATTTADGRGAASTTTYRYEGALWSDSERRFLGFRKVSAVIDAAGNYTETYYHQHVGCISKPEATYFRDAAGNIYSYSTHVYTENAAPPYTSLLTARWDYECNQTATCRRVLAELSYDAYGNVTQTTEHGDYDLAGDERTTVRGYAANAARYLVGLPAYENVYAGVGPGGALVRQTLYEYDGNASYATPPTVGNLVRTKRWDNQSGGYAVDATAYDGVGNRVAETDALGHTTTFAYDPVYQIYNVATCGPLGACAQRSWDPVLGARLSETDVNGGTTSWALDAFGRVTQETAPNGHVVTTAYLSFGDPSQQRVRTSFSDGTSAGLWEEVYQDGLGRVWRTAKAGGFTRDTLYADASSRVWKESAWYGAGETPAWEVYAYDGAGRLRTVTHADGTVAQRVYGPGTVTVRDELGHETVVWKDAYGRTTQVREQSGGTYAYTTRAYDALGHLLTLADAAGHQTTASWDSLGRKVAECAPDLGCTRYAYDAVGHLVGQTDAKGQTLAHEFDALGRVTRRTSSTGEVASYSYDESGRGASVGRLTTMSNAAGSESRSYDFAGRVTAATKCVSGVCESFGWSYDARGLLTAVTYPDGEVVSYGYDALGRLASVGGYVTALAYDARGHVTGVTYANGTSGTFTYDARRQWLTEARWSAGAAPLYEASYSYDAAARVTAMSSSTNPRANLGFTYDELNRLTGVTGGQTQSFTYDALGNLTSNSALGAYRYDDPAHPHAVTAAGGASYSYDAAGNLIAGGGRTLTWDAEHRPLTVTANGATSAFAYDALGARVRKASAAETTLYFGPLAELTGASLTKYYWAGPLLVAKRDATGPYFYHQDHLGSVRALTNGSGALVRSYDYAPFGATVATSGAVANALGWGGHRTDAETGLVYLNARYYDPQLGRFISADPVIPDEGNPQALNRYAFGYNNPVSNVDPSGHAPVVAAVVAVVSVAASTAPAWVVAVAAVGAACTIAGYALKDPLLMTIGSIALGFAGGFAAPMFGMSALAGGVLGAAVAAATSPLSPLDPGLKQAIGWGYTALGLISSLTRPPAHDELRGAGGATDQRAGVTPAEQKANLDKLLAEHPEGLDAKLVYGDINANATATAAGMQHSTMGLYAHGTDTWLGEIGGNPDGAGLYLAKTAGAGGPGHATAMWTIQNISKDQLYKAIDAANSVLNPGPSGYATAWVCHNVAARISDALGQSYTWSVVGGGVAAQAAFGNGGLWSNLWRSATPGLGSLLAGENLLVGAYRLFH